MTIQTVCPHCNEDLEFDQMSVGTTVACPYCCGMVEIKSDDFREELAVGNRGEYEYKVLTQRDKQWTILSDPGRINAEKFEKALNHYGMFGWRVITCTTVSSGATARNELVCILERKRPAGGQ